MLCDIDSMLETDVICASPKNLSGSMKRVNWKPKKIYSSIEAQSDRLVLRPFHASDFENWRCAHKQRKPKQNIWDPGALPARKLTRTAFATMLRHHQKMAAERRLFVFAAFDKKTGEHLGTIDIYLFSHELRWANLGYEFHNHLWGQGYGPEAARLALDIAFGPLNLHRVEASCDPRNFASAKTAERAGLLSEGLRKKFFPEDGGIDIVVFGTNAIDHRRMKSQVSP
jgi:RimJ/RimL family protein N-acetyltransferase